MIATSDASRLLPPGPDRPFDLNTTDESFQYIPQLLAEFGDIVRVPPAARSADSFLINHPDYVKHVLVTNHKNYTKGVGFERVKMLLGIDVFPGVDTLPDHAIKRLIPWFGG